MGQKLTCHLGHRTIKSLRGKLSVGGLSEADFHGQFYSGVGVRDASHRINRAQDSIVAQYSGMRRFDGDRNVTLRQFLSRKPDVLTRSPARDLQNPVTGKAFKSTATIFIFHSGTAG